MALTAYVTALWLDPERRAKAISLLWWTSTLMLGLGYLVIADHYMGAWPWR